MEIKRIIIYFCLSLFLSGCLQSTAMVGPAITLASTGNASQAGIALFTNKAVEQETGMTTSKYVSTKIQENNKKKRINKGLVDIVKINFKKTRQKLLLQNQSKKFH